MEGCANEIQVSFSPLELEVVRRAVEKFAHVEASGTRSLNQLDHAKNVIRIINKKMAVRVAPKCGPSSANEMREAEKSIRLFPQTRDSFFSRLLLNLKGRDRRRRQPVLIERCVINGRWRTERTMKAPSERLDKCYVVSKSELEEIM